MRRFLPCALLLLLSAFSRLSGAAEVDGGAPPLTASFSAAFVAALVAVTGVAVMLGWMLLRHRASARSRGRMHERLLERSRIARELHDTLLQDVLSLGLQLDAVRRRLPSHDPVRQELERAIDQSERVVADGRDRIAGLRVSGARVGDLEDALEGVADELSAKNGPRFTVRVMGPSRALEGIVFDEAYHLCREAMANAAHHAGGTQVNVDVAYSCDALRVRVQDDGQGIDEQVLASGGLGGHWGLQSMRERAERIGGRLLVRRGSTQGTMVLFSVPSRLAYRIKPVRAQLGMLMQRLRGSGALGATPVVERRIHDTAPRLSERGRR